MKSDILTIQEVRQSLSEKCPGFVRTLAAAMDIGVVQLLDAIAAGRITKSDALLALAALKDKP